MRCVFARPLSLLAILLTCLFCPSTGGRTLHPHLHDLKDAKMYDFTQPEGAAETIEAKVPSQAKKFVFIRHGKSQGNAGVAGAFKQMYNGENRKFSGYKDGKLTSSRELKLNNTEKTSSGEQQVIDRVGAMDRTMLGQIADAQLVIVSPLSRTLATAVMMLAAVRNRCQPQAPGSKGLCADKWPGVMVDVGLREKVKSYSEMPNCGEHSPFDYLDEIRAKIEATMKNVPMQHLSAFIEAMKMDYTREFELRTNAEQRAATRCVDWNPLPKNGYTFIEMIRDFKSRVAQRQEASLVLVSHSGWGRYAFGAYLPASEAQAAQVNLVQGSRPVKTLNNCGIIVGEINTAGLFQNVQVDPISPGTDVLPNLEAKGKLGFFVSGAEAEAGGATPAGSCMDRFIFEKKSKYRKTWETRMFLLSWVRGAATLTWGDKWGTYMNSMPVDEQFSAVHSSEAPSPWQLKITRGPKSFTVRMTDGDIDESAFMTAITEYQAGKPC